MSIWHWASAPLLHIERDVFMAMGRVPQMLRGYLGPDSLDVLNQDVARSSHFESTAQSIGEYLVKFVLLRRGRRI